MKLLTEVNFSHNDISNIPYSFGQLEKYSFFGIFLLVPKSLF
jgi:hypothetical protein